MGALTVGYRVFTCFMPVSNVNKIQLNFIAISISLEENLRIQNSFSNDRAKIISPIIIEEGARIDGTILGGRREGKWRKQYPEKFRGNTAWRKSTKPRGTTSGNLIKMVAVILVK